MTESGEGARSLEVVDGKVLSMGRLRSLLRSAVEEDPSAPELDARQMRICRAITFLAWVQTGSGVRFEGSGRGPAVKVDPQDMANRLGISTDAAEEGIHHLSRLGILVPGADSLQITPDAMASEAFVRSLDWPLVLSRIEGVVGWHLVVAELAQLLVVPGRWERLARRDLRRGAGMSERTIDRAMEELEEAAVIERKRVPGKESEFRFASEVYRSAPESTGPGRPKVPENPDARVYTIDGRVIHVPPGSDIESIEVGDVVIRFRPRT